MIPPILPKPLTYKGKQLFSHAWEWGKNKHPHAPIQQHYAFAASVLDLARNEVDYQDMGPSCRCHTVSIAAAGDGDIKHLSSDFYAVFPDGRMPVLGEWGFEQACRFAEPYCYGKLTALHIRCYKNLPCFDEAPEDLEELKKAFILALGERICLICQENKLRHNNKSGVCTRCQRNKRKRL